MITGSPYSQKKFDKKDIIFYAFLLLFSLFILASSFSEPLKYLKYTLPVLLFVVLFCAGKRITVNRKSLTNNRRFRYVSGLLVFYLFVCAINIGKGFSNTRFYQEFYFVLSPILFALLLLFLRPSKDYARAIYILFWGVAIAFVAEKFPFFLEEIKNPSLLVNAFLTSELPTESNYAFQFGLFFLVFLHRRNKAYSFLALGLLVLSFKRIAIAGVLLVIFLAILRKVSGHKLNPGQNKRLILLVNGVVVFLLFMFFAGTFDEFIEETFGVSSNFITQGRYNIYQDIFHRFGKIDLLGFGLGSINVFLSSTGYELVNLHSDLLKVFFELGPIVFFAWIYFFYKWTNTFLSAGLAIYLNVLFLTDNVFIYFDVMFVFYIVMLYAFEKQDGTGSNDNAYTGHVAVPAPAT